MRSNETRLLLMAGKPALAAEIAGHCGFDWVLVDLQHGENNLGNLGGMLQAISATPATPFVRVPVNDFMLINRALDLGAYGGVVPLVNTTAAAAAVVRAAKYPPRGARSWGPVRGSLYGGADYFQRADDETLVIVMLETAEAVGNARDILAISFGIGPEGGGGEEMPAIVEEALAAVAAAAKETDKVAGIQLYSAAAANRRIAQGYRFIGMGADVRLMRGAAAAMLGGVER